MLINDKATGDRVVRYAYDPLGRRVKKIIYAEQIPLVFTPIEYYYYDGDRVVEIQRDVDVDDTTVGDFLADDCNVGGGAAGDPNALPPPPPPPPPPPGPPPPGGGESEKRIVAADGTPGLSDTGTKDRSSVEGGGDVILTSSVAGGQPKKESRINFAAQAQTELRTLRRFVYGLDYINEVVAQITPTKMADSTFAGQKLRYVYQDGNYNVVGIARACDGQLIRQMRYSPYGELEAVEDGAGVELPSDVDVDSWHAFQGMYYDRETATDATGLNGNYFVNARTYHPILGRFGQRDPNGQALTLANTLAMNGQTRQAFANL